MDALSRAKPVAELPASSCRALAGIACDLDDTVTTEGKLGAEAYGALWRAHEAGLRVVPVTGRPAGWVDHFARMWPVDGVVGENGGLYCRHVDGKMRRRYAFPEDERAGHREGLREIGREILAAVPGAAVAADQFARELDLAIDYAEDVPRLPDEDVDRIVEIFERHGCTAKVSSIHVNGWFGTYDKLGMLRTFFAEELGIDVEAEPERLLFVGDSPNDEPLFTAFPISVGVANVADFRKRLVHGPAYVASKRGGAGFAETVEVVLRMRGA